MQDLTPSRLAIFEGDYGDASLESEAAGELGVDVEFVPVDAAAPVPEAALAADGVLVRHRPIGDELMAAAPGWRVIGRYGVGVDDIDTDAAARRGIEVVNVPDYCVEEVATHALALALACVRDVPHAARNVDEGRWGEWAEIGPPRALSSLTLGVIGRGRIGAELLRQAAPLFGTRIAFDPAADGPLDGVELVELAGLLERSDVISLHVPLSEDTVGLVDERAIAAMRPGVILVNVSRGGLIDELALHDALDSGHVAGAGLDVLSSEPPSADDPLVGHPAVLITNHVAWYSDAALVRLRTTLARRCAEVLTGAG